LGRVQPSVQSPTELVFFTSCICGEDCRRGFSRREPGGGLPLVFLCFGLQDKPQRQAARINVNDLGAEVASSVESAVSHKRTWFWLLPGQLQRIVEVVPGCDKELQHFIVMDVRKPQSPSARSRRPGSLVC
jgi:hypothetical protein